MTNSPEFIKLKNYFKRKQWKYHQMIIDDILENMKRQQQQQKHEKIEELQRELELLRK